MRSFSWHSIAVCGACMLVMLTISGCRRVSEKAPEPAPSPRRPAPQPLSALDPASAQAIKSLLSDPMIPPTAYQKLAVVQDHTDIHGQRTFGLWGGDASAIIGFGGNRGLITSARLAVPDEPASTALPVAQLRKLAGDFFKRRFPQLAASGGKIDVVCPNLRSDQSDAVVMWGRMSRQGYCPTRPLEIELRRSTGHVISFHYHPQLAELIPSAVALSSRSRCLTAALARLKRYKRDFGKQPELLDEVFSRHLEAGSPSLVWTFWFIPETGHGSGGSTLQAHVEVNAGDSQIRYLDVSATPDNELGMFWQDG